jgi:hypothetical protein
MVDAVHGWRNEQYLEDLFEPRRPLRLLCWNWDVKTEKALENDHTDQVGANNIDETYLDYGGYGELADVEAAGI